MAFPRQRAGERALQAVEVQSLRRAGDAAGGGLRPYTFTFCLEHVDRGPYKVCLELSSSSGSGRAACLMTGVPVGGWPCINLVCLVRLGKQVNAAGSVSSPKPLPIREGLCLLE